MADPAREPQTVADIRAMLDVRGVRPKKALGQNFLIDANLVHKLADASGAGAGDTVLEVGPGTGVLTEALLARGCRVIAVELDDVLAELLRERLAPELALGAFTLIHGDCLARKRELSREAAAALGDAPFRLVANLPYHAATPLLLALMTRHPACAGAWVTIQSEVADRLAAGPGTKAYGSISVIAGALGAVRRLATLPPSCFWPRPEVISAMIAWTRDWTRDKEPAAGTDPAWWPRFADMCQTLFASRRKQLGAVVRKLAGDIAWPEGVEPTMRVEQLDPRAIVTLVRAMDAGSHGS